MPSSNQGDRAIVLLVDDEADVRAAVQEMLEMKDILVLSANGPVEALSLALLSPRIDLVVSDVVMPKMSGSEMAAEILRIHPGAKLLLLSGYTEHPTLGKRCECSHVFLQKPFNRDALVETVGILLDGEGEYGIKAACC